MRIAVVSLLMGGTTRLLATLPKDAEIGSMEVITLIKFSINILIKLVIIIIVIIVVMMMMIIIRVERSSFWFLLAAFSLRSATRLL